MGEMEASRNLGIKRRSCCPPPPRTYTHTQTHELGRSKTRGVGGGGFELGSSCVRRAKRGDFFSPFGAAA